MDKDKARDREARRTLKRIEHTLHDLDDGSAWKDPMDNDEFKWMKNLVESGYQHPPRNWKQRLIVFTRHPLFVVMIAVIIGLLISTLVQ